MFQIFESIKWTTQALTLGIVCESRETVVIIEPLAPNL